MDFSALLWKYDESFAKSEETDRAALLPSARLFRLTISETFQHMPLHPMKAPSPDVLFSLCRPISHQLSPHHTSTPNISTRQRIVSPWRAQRKKHWPTSDHQFPSPMVQSLYAPRNGAIPEQSFSFLARGHGPWFERETGSQPIIPNDVFYTSAVMWILQLIPGLLFLAVSTAAGPLRRGDSNRYVLRSLSGNAVERDIDGPISIIPVPDPEETTISISVPATSIPASSSPTTSSSSILIPTSSTLVSSIITTSSSRHLTTSSASGIISSSIVSTSSSTSEIASSSTPNASSSVTSSNLLISPTSTLPTSTPIESQTSSSTSQIQSSSATSLETSATTTLLPSSSTLSAISSSFTGSAVSPSETSQTSSEITTTLGTNVLTTGSSSAQTSSSSSIVASVNRTLTSQTVTAPESSSVILTTGISSSTSVISPIGTDPAASDPVSQSSGVNPVFSNTTSSIAQTETASPPTSLISSTGSSTQLTSYLQTTSVSQTSETTSPAVGSTGASIPIGNSTSSAGILVIPFQTSTLPISISVSSSAASSAPTSVEITSSRTIPAIPTSIATPLPTESPGSSLNSTSISRFTLNTSSVPPPSTPTSPATSTVIATSSLTTTLPSITQAPTIIPPAQAVTTSLSPAASASLLAQAQSYNNLFSTLNFSSPCTSGEIACISGNTGTCNTAGNFVISTCAAGTSCLAVPISGDDGIYVGCTATASASSILGLSSTNAPVATTAAATSVQTTPTDIGTATSSSHSSSIPAASSQPAVTTPITSSLVVTIPIESTPTPTITSKSQQPITTVTTSYTPHLTSTFVITIPRPTSTPAPTTQGNSGLGITIIPVTGNAQSVAGEKTVTVTVTVTKTEVSVSFFEELEYSSYTLELGTRDDNVGEERRKNAQVERQLPSVRSKTAIEVGEDTSGAKRKSPAANSVGKKLKAAAETPYTKIWDSQMREVKPKAKKLMPGEGGIKTPTERGTACKRHYQAKTLCDPERCPENKLYLRKNTHSTDTPSVPSIAPQPSTGSPDSCPDVASPKTKESNMLKLSNILSFPEDLSSDIALPKETAPQIWTSSALSSSQPSRPNVTLGNLDLSPTVNMVTLSQDPFLRSPGAKSPWQTDEWFDQFVALPGSSTRPDTNAVQSPDYFSGMQSTSLFGDSEFTDNSAVQFTGNLSNISAPGIETSKAAPNVSTFGSGDENNKNSLSGFNDGNAFETEDFSAMPKPAEIRCSLPTPNTGRGGGGGGGSGASYYSAGDYGRGGYYERAYYGGGYGEDYTIETYRQRGVDREARDSPCRASSARGKSNGKNKTHRESRQNTRHNGSESSNRHSAALNTTSYSITNRSYLMDDLVGRFKSHHIEDHFYE
ncbi:hypothetical protein B7494_g6306 [Chlorociboria aeruginascens]|nr:hypothetical protein B7494_g6306 [Chlorociboria aeruginascens]